MVEQLLVELQEEQEQLEQEELLVELLVVVEIQE